MRNSFYRHIIQTIHIERTKFALYSKTSD